MLISFDEQAINEMGTKNGKKNLVNEDEYNGHSQKGNQRLHCSKNRDKREQDGFSLETVHEATSRTRSLFNNCLPKK